MLLDDQLTVICLLRKDDSHGAKEHGCDAKTFLEKIKTKMQEHIDLISFPDRCRIRYDFFLLGRASKACIYSSASLSSTAESIQILNKIGFDLGKSIDSSLGAFELNAFPAIKINEYPTRLNGVLPGLFFARTLSVAKSLHSMLSQRKVLGDSFEALIGFGCYNLIFVLRENTLTELRRRARAIRATLGGFWETRTIIGVPEENLRDEEIRLAASEPYHRFSIMMKCRGELTKAIEKQILQITNEGKFSKIFSELNNGQEKITSRQGYMDVEVPCCSQTVGEVFDAACEFRRRVQEVFDTATIVRFGFP